MYQSFKYRIYPNKEQKELIEKHFGCSRYIYNWSLQNRISYYQDNNNIKKKLDIINELPELKNKFPWLKEVNSQSLQSSVEDMDTAFKNFFRMKKGFPNFHKKNGKQSFHIPQAIKLNIVDKKISVRKINNIKINLDRNPEGVIKQATISKTTTGKYFISILCLVEVKNPLKKTDGVIGVDLGIKYFATLSTGEKIENPKFLNKSMKRLKKKQRALSKKVKGSNNRNKARIVVAKMHEKISNQRTDFLHKVSTKLIRENQAICIEDLNVSGMIRNHKLSQAIGDCSWRKFRSMIEYKAAWYGRQVYTCGRFDPSSKTCTCGHINNQLKLSMREWTCSECGTLHDRDILAANNIKTFALTRAGIARCNASGDDKLLSSMKEEISN